MLPGEAVPINAIAPRQEHSGTIIRAADLVQQELTADGVVLESVGEVGSVSTADCAAVAILSERRAILLHVSRKSLIHGLLENAFSYMAPSSVDRVWVGPHICEYHLSFEREEPDLKRFRVRYPEAVHFHQGKLHISLRAALESVWSEWDIHPQRVNWDGRCTWEHDDLPSYRRSLAKGKYTKPLTGLRTVMWRDA